MDPKNPYVKKTKRNQRRGVVGVEAAIVLIAFVIVAAALAFVVLNMGFASSQKAKTTTAQGINSASNVLEVSAQSIAHLNSTNSQLNVWAVPIKLATGATPVDLSKGTLAVKYFSKTVSYDNIMNGTLNTKTYTNISDALADANTNLILSKNPLASSGAANPSKTVAIIYWETKNTLNNNVMSPGDHAVLAIVYKGTEQVPTLDRVNTEVITPLGASLTVQRDIPTSLADTWTNLS